MMMMMMMMMMILSVVVVVIGVPSHHWSRARLTNWCEKWMKNSIDSTVHRLVNGQIIVHDTSLLLAAFLYTQWRRQDLVRGEHEKII